jgi:WD40 repeat protein
MNKFISLAICFAVLFTGCTQADEPLDHGKGHFGAVFTAAFSPDGKKIVTASYDLTARIWDVESGEELHTLKGHTGHSSGVNSAAFSPDGKKIVTTGSDGLARGPENDANAFAYDHTLFPNGIGTVRIWDAETGKEIHKLEGYKWGASNAAFSPDGKKVVANGGENYVLIWDADTGKVLQKLEGHTENVYSAVFSSDGKKMVTSGRDKIVRIWDVESGKEITKLEEHKLGAHTIVVSVIDGASFSSDGKKVIASGYSGIDDGKSVKYTITVLIWDTDTGKILQKLERDTDRGEAGMVSFSPDGKKLISSGSLGSLIFDAESGKELLKLPGCRSAVFSPDGKQIVTVVGETIKAGTSTVTIWDAESGKELKKWQWKTSFWKN